MGARKQHAINEQNLRPITTSELKRSSRRWLTRFNFAFALMSIIPLLICCYLITVKFFSFSILAGMNGLYFLLAVILALLGLLVGRQVIGHIIRRLTEMNERLNRFQAMQSEFVSHVAHEFRSPLAIVKGAMDNLKDGLYGDITTEQMEPIAIAEREVSRLKRVVGDLLDIGQIESGKLNLRQEELVLQDLLRDVTQSCKGLSSAKGLDLDLDVPKESVKVIADKDRMSQVLINLMTNAIKFTEQGGVSVRLARNGRTVQIEVADTGPGMSPEDLERIFRKFERVGDQRREGSGLGLPIAKAIVELHKGHIEVESQLGQGSRFSVYLPTPL